MVSFRGETLSQKCSSILNCFIWGVWASASLPVSQPYIGEKRLLRRGAADPFTSPGCLWSMSSFRATPISINRKCSHQSPPILCTQSISLCLSASNCHLPHFFSLVSQVSILRALDHAPLCAAQGRPLPAGSDHTPHVTVISCGHTKAQLKSHAWN